MRCAHSQPCFERRGFACQIRGSRRSLSARPVMPSAGSSGRCAALLILALLSTAILDRQLKPPSKSFSKVPV